MKKLLLATLLLLMNLSGATALAYNTDTFDVSDVLNVTDTTSDNEEVTTELGENLQEEADEKGTSVAGALILRAINILSLLIGTFAFVVILYSGLMMVTAGGDESKIDNAKSMLIQAIFGIVLAFLAYFIVAFVQSFFY